MRQRIVDARAAANEKARKQVAKLAEQRAADLAKAREAEEAAAEAETEKETEEGRTSLLMRPSLRVRRLLRPSRDHQSCRTSLATRSQTLRPPRLTAAA